MKKSEINPLLKSIILNFVDASTPKRNTKIGRPKKCSNEQYIEAMFYVLKTGIAWEYLKGFPVSGDTVRKKFKQWTNMGIFYNSWLVALKIYENFKVNFKDVYIDASHIKNYFGSECIGSNVYDRFRNGTKLTIIVDEIGVPISISLGPSNNHDITFMRPSIENVNIDIDKCDFLIGDKGYISKKESSKLADLYSIKLVTPRRRKNGKKIRGRKPKYHYKLKNRFIVEHSFSWLKNYYRLVHRKDKTINMFKNFIYFGASDLTLKKMAKYVFV